MARYFPLPIGSQARSSDCSLNVLRWQDRSIWLDLQNKRTGKPVFRVHFPEVAVHRFTDDLSIIERPIDEAADDYLAFKVEDSLLIKGMAAVLADDPPFNNLQHFRLMMRDGCLDVICAKPPIFRSLTD